MRMIFIIGKILILLILVCSNIYADEIYLKNGSAVQGTILRVSEKIIEFDPDGDKPFMIYPRTDIIKFVNNDGCTVYVTDGKDEKTIRGMSAGKDSIYYFGGLMVTGKIVKITGKYIEYTPEPGSENIFLKRGEIIKLLYADGVALSLNEKETAVISDRLHAAGEKQPSSDSGNEKISNDIQKQSAEKKKSAWYLGFGLGGYNQLFINGPFRIDERYSSYREFDRVNRSSEDGVYLHFGAGIILNNFIHIGPEINLAGSNGNDYCGSIIFTDIIAVLTYFPNKTGFFLKFGAGYSITEFTTKGYVSDSEDSSVAKSFNGIGYKSGIGYAFWLGETFNLGINADYSSQIYLEHGAPDNSGYWSIYVSLYWF